MTRRLVLGIVYIQRWSLLYQAVMVGVLSGQRRWLGVVAVMIALVMGMKARDGVAKREFAPLPVRAGDLHRAEWILSALVPVALLTVGRLLGGTWQAALGDGGWTFQASAPQVIFEIVYFSLFSAWIVRESEEPLLPRVFVGIAFLAAPFIAIDRLPIAIDDVSALWWICAMVLLGVGLRPLISPPLVYQRSSPTVAFEPPPLPARLRPPTTPDFASRFEGMWVPMRGVMAQALVWTLVMLTVVAAAQHMRGTVTLWWPFDSTMTDLRFLTTIGIPIMFLIGLCPSLAPWMGVLKRLPLSSRRVALLLSLAPTTMPIVFWTALLVLHFLVSAQTPDDLRLSQLMVFIGFVALIDALGTKSGSGTIRLALGFSLFVPFVFGMDTNRALVEATLAHWGLPLVGVLCLALAWTVNFHTLTRSPGSARAFQLGRPTHTVGAR